MSRDVILNKKESLERCIKQAREYFARPSNVDFREDCLRQDAIAINLQRATELAIDMANHVIKDRRLGLPKESRQSFEILEKSGIIPQELARTLQGMVKPIHPARLPLAPFSTAARETSTTAAAALTRRAAVHDDMPAEHAWGKLMEYDQTTSCRQEGPA